MKKITWPLLLAMGLGVFSPSQAKVEHILPIPQKVEFGQGAKGVAVLRYAPGSAITVSGVQGNPTLVRFFKEFGIDNVTFKNGDGANVTVQMVSEIAGAHNYTLAKYDPFENEAYTLEVTAAGIKITAVSEVGVTRAAQSLAQMAEGWGTKEGVQLEAVKLTDWPAFKVRGFMHDVGRSFMTIEQLKEQIDLLSRFKVDVFHWHLTEKLAWRFQVNAYPKLTQDKFMKRYAGQYYTQQQCRDLVDYAAERGVMVIPEIDMPGHSDVFTHAMGHDMQSAEGIKELKVILDEVVEVFAKSPYIHIGGDEVSIKDPNYLKNMADYVRGKGKKVVVWNQLVAGAPNTDQCDMTQMWATRGRVVNGLPNIDCRYNYTNHFDVYADLVGIYKSNIFYEKKGTPEVAGTISAAWNDTKTDTELEIIRQNNMYANILASSCRAWQGGGETYIETGGTSLPNDGAVYDDFVEFENRFLFHKDNTLQKVADLIPYVKQSNVRWRITDQFPNGGDKALQLPPETSEAVILPETYEYNGETYGSKIATGAGFYLRHIWHSTIPSFYSNPANNMTAYAWTYVYSKTAQDVGAQIEFYTYSRSGSEKAPERGQWDRRGSKVWLNDVEIPAPEWAQPGASIPQDHATAGLKNENFTARPVIPLHLNAGWNKVFMRLPHVNSGGTGRDKWQFTFVFTDRQGKHAVEGLIYSPNQCIDAAAESVAMKISEVRAFRNSKVKNQPGFYDPALAGSLDATIAKIEPTLSKTGYTNEQRAAQITELNNALKSFQAELQKAAILMPMVSNTQESHWYTLSTPLRGNRFATGHGQNADIMGETTVSTHSYWKFESRQDGTYNIVNYDGTYVSPKSSDSKPLKTQKAVTNPGWSIKGGNATGEVIISSGSVQFHQTNSGTYPVWNWGGGSKKDDDGCKYAIKPVNLTPSDLLQPKLSSNEVEYYYTIKSVKRNNRFVTSKGSNNAMIGEAAESRSAYWKFVNRTDGKGYDIINCADGTYISPVADHNAAIKSQAGTPNRGWRIKVGDANDNVIITSENVQLNQTQSGLGWKIYNWGQGKDTYENPKDAGCIFALTEVSRDKWEVVEPAMPVVGCNYFFYNKHNAGDQHYYDNEGKVGFAGEGSFNNTAYVWTCEEAQNGKFYFKNLKTGKYFAWQSLSQNAYAWEVSDKMKGNGASGVFRKGCVTMKGTEKYLVGMQNGFDQAIKAEYNTTTFSSDFKFDRCGLPVVGQRYYFYNKFPTGNQYFYDKKDGNVGFSKSKVEDDKTYVWVCETAGNGNYAFKNLATQQYFSWKSIKANPCEWIVKTDKDGTARVTNEGCVSMQAKNQSGSNFMVCKENGFDHAQNAGFYGAGGNGTVYSSDFYFELIPTEVKVETPADFICANYGDKWVRIDWSQNTNSTAGFAPGTTTFNAVTPKGYVKDFTSTEQLWTLVGDNNNGFYLQNKAAGNGLALKVDNTNDGSASTMVAKESANKWKLVPKAAGLYAIEHATAAGRGLNSWSGAYGELKMYGSNDNGSKWKMEVVVPSFELSTEVVGEIEDQYTNGVSLNFNVNGVVSTSKLSGSKAASVCYLPEGAKVKVTQGISRGYKGDGLLLNGNPVRSVELVIAKDMTDKVSAKFEAGYENGLYLYKTPGKYGHPYRIPAIATAPNGDIIAISDFRTCGADIGNGEVDIMYRISKDNGRTWTTEEFLANGVGDTKEKPKNTDWNVGFGDAAVVMDCERNEFMALMVCGRTVCWNANYSQNNPNRVAMVRGHFDEVKKQWIFDEPIEVTERIYPLFKKESGEITVESLFVGSGRICQSRVTKVKDYYRLYCSTWTKNGGNRVIYSDDFGETWKVLGGVDARPGTGGDEPKCEEMPNGDVILSSRGHGRVFNVFRFTDRNKGEGQWTTEQWSDGYPGGIKVGSSQSTNGEIMVLKAIRMEDNTKVDLALQSVPFGAGRTEVGLFFKEMTSDLYDHSKNHGQSVIDLASHWNKGLQVSNVGSAYSTLTLQKDNKIGFLFEEEPGGYCIVYIPLSIEQITGNKYQLDTDAYGVFVTTHEAKNLDCSLASFSSIQATTPNVAGVRAFYAVDQVGESVKMMEIKPDADGKVVVPAETGVLLETAHATKFSMIPTEKNSVALDNNLLRSTANSVVNVPAEDNAYILSGDEAGNAAFYKLSENSKERVIAKNCAYLVLSNASNAGILSISFGDITGIEGIAGGSENMENAPVYDLSGRRVVKADKRGIYIRNGKKFIVK